MPKFEISQAVGQPTADRPFGGRGVPDLTPARKSHTGRNLAVGLVSLGVVAAGVGVAINAGKGDPQPSQNPGGIVEPSASPSPEQSITIPSATPGESFVATLPPNSPSPEATEPPPLKTIDDILKTEPNKDITDDMVKEDVQKAYDNQDNHFDHPLSFALQGVDVCVSGKATADNNKYEARAIACAGYVRIYLNEYNITKDSNAYKAAVDFRDLALATLPQEYHQYFFDLLPLTK